MSREEQIKFSNDIESKTIENVPLSLHNIHNLLNTSDLNNSQKDNNVLNNNFVEITSLSNNNMLETNVKNTISSNYSNILQNAELSIESFIFLLYQELFLSNKKFNNDTYFKNCQKKLATLLNNEKNNQNIFSDILKVFNESIKRIIETKLKEINSSLNQHKSNILFLEQSNRYLVKQNFLKQTKIDILENEIDSYIEMEEEFDEMKEKLKYENGKFLHNEKKENEILILRAENSNLKKIIDKNERTIEEKELIIESIKKKSSSMLNTNNNTIKNSFELNDTDNPMLQQHNPTQRYSHNSSNITNYKSYNNIQKYKSPKNDLIYKTNNNSQRSNNKKLSYVENNGYQNSKRNIIGNRVSTKELISKRIKNKVLNMKKIRRINNDSCLEHYNKSSAHITNSIISNNSNNSSKRIKKNLNSYFKNIKNNIFNGTGKIHKKLNSGLTNGNLSNLIKNNNNKIIVNSILENNINNISNNLYNNNSFLFKTTRKKFSATKKNLKTNIKHTKDEYVMIRNNNSLIKSPNTFNNNDFENSVAMKNNNIIINNIIQNSSSIPVSGPSSKSKEKGNIVENELNRTKSNNNNCKQYSSAYIYKRDKNMKQKSSGLLSVNIKKKIE
jgi:hypothetical protein